MGHQWQGVCEIQSLCEDWNKGRKHTKARRMSTLYHMEQAPSYHKMLLAFPGCKAKQNNLEPLNNLESYSMHRCMKSHI